MIGKNLSRNRQGGEQLVRRESSRSFRNIEQINDALEKSNLYKDMQARLSSDSLDLQEMITTTKLTDDSFCISRPLPSREDTDKSWKRLEVLFSSVSSDDSINKQNTEVETTYFDSLSPYNQNQVYIDKLKEDIVNLRKEYASKPKTNPSEENLVKRSFLEDLAKTKGVLAQKSNATKRKDLESRKDDGWFGSGRFQDSGERMRMNGGRRYSESRIDKGRLGRSLEFGMDDKNLRLAHSKNTDLDNVKVRNDFRANSKFDTNYMYKEIMEALKVKNPSKVGYGNERLANWLLDSRMQENFGR